MKWYERVILKDFINILVISGSSVLCKLFGCKYIYNQCPAIMALPCSRILLVQGLLPKCGGWALGFLLT